VRGDLVTTFHWQSATMVALQNTVTSTASIQAQSVCSNSQGARSVRDHLSEHLGRLCSHPRASLRFEVFVMCRTQLLPTTSRLLNRPLERNHRAPSGSDRLIPLNLTNSRALCRAFSPELCRVIRQGSAGDCGAAAVKARRPDGCCNVFWT